MDWWSYRDRDEFKKNVEISVTSFKTIEIFI